MELQVWKKNLEIVSSNEERAKELLKEGTKIGRLASYMLKGYPVTGAVMIRFFDIYSYRDAIYNLTKRGFKVSSEILSDYKGITHKLWWLSEFDKEFVKDREEKIF